MNSSWEYKSYRCNCESKCIKIRQTFDSFSKCSTHCQCGKPCRVSVWAFWKTEPLLCHFAGIREPGCSQNLNKGKKLNKFLWGFPHRRINLPIFSGRVRNNCCTSILWISRSELMTGMLSNRMKHSPTCLWVRPSISDTLRLNPMRASGISRCSCESFLKSEKSIKL